MNQFHGEGVLENVEEGKTYEGAFVEGKKHGKGREQYRDESVYIGDFWENEKHGTGTMHFKNGNKYIGQWVNDRQHGNGIFTSLETGEKRQGEWKDGKRIRWLNNPIRINGENN
jgi:hypothetical protein